MHRLLPAIAACALCAASHAQTIYKCQGAVTEYTDRPCAQGPAIALSVPASTPDPDTLARLQRQNALAAQLDRRDAARAEREARARQRDARTAAALQQKCARLRLQRQWAAEDARQTRGRGADAARLRLRRRSDLLALECPA